MMMKEFYIPVLLTYLLAYFCPFQPVIYHALHQVSFNTYYKVIGDTSAGIYYYESAMAALLVCSIAGSIFLKRRGVGFWDM